MGKKACTVLAYVKLPNGKVVESRLYNDLLHYTSENRQLTKEYYAVGTNREFLAKARESENYEEDENGEITFSSLKKLIKIDLEEDKLLKVLNKDFKEGDYPYDLALEKVKNFNERTPFSDKFFATMQYVGDGKYHVEIVKKDSPMAVDTQEGAQNETVSPQKKLHSSIRNAEVERRLKALLKRHGVSVRFLEGDMQGGRYSTDNVKRLEDGLWGLIEINEYGNTTDTLAEEAGHFAVAALGENPLVQRLENLLKNGPVQREALGEEELSRANLGNNPAREIAGRLVGKALAKRLDKGLSIKRIVDRIANLAKRIVSKIKGNEVAWAAAKAEQIADKIAYSFKEEDSDFDIRNALEQRETLRSVNKTVNQQIYEDVVNSLGLMVRQLQTITTAGVTNIAKSSFGQVLNAAIDDNTEKSALQIEAVDTLTKTVADTLAMNGIAQALMQVHGYLEQGQLIDTLRHKVNLNNPSEFYPNMVRSAKALRQARIIFESAVTVVDAVSKALTEYGPNITLVNGTSIHDIQYKDTDGTTRTLDLDAAIRTCKRLLAEHKSQLDTAEAHFLARFCEDIYGKKYVTRAARVTWKSIWSGENRVEERNFSMDDLVAGRNCSDIDYLHAAIGSMSDNPDIVGQIADRAVRVANAKATETAKQYQDRIAIIEKRADALGINMEDLMERNPQTGIVTGNMVTPPAAPGDKDPLEDAIYKFYMDKHGRVPALNYGWWEEEKEKARQEAWEDFKSKYPNYKEMPGMVREYHWNEVLKDAMKAFHAKNSVKVTVEDEYGEELYKKWVPNIIYESTQWEELKQKYDKKNKNNKSGDSMTKVVRAYLDIKRSLDDLLPMGATETHRLPQFRGTFTSAIRRKAEEKSGPLKKTRSWLSTLGRRGFLDLFSESSEEQDYGDQVTMNNVKEEYIGTEMKYESQRVERLPIFGVNKIAIKADLSSDLIGSLGAYAAMATTFDAMSSVVDALEVGRNALRNRNGFEDIPVGKKGTDTRAFKRYEKYMKAQVYGATATYQNIVIGAKHKRRFLLNKAIKTINSLGGIMFLGGNVLGGAVNTGTGVINVFKEAAVADLFNLKDWTFANAYYFKYFLPMWSTDVGKLRKNNKLSLFLEHVDFQGSTNRNLRNWRTTRSRLNNFMRDLMFLPYSSGDHYMQAMSYLAVAHGTRLYNANNTAESTNLWNAYETIDNEENGVKAGKRLQFKGYCPTAASEMTAARLNSETFWLKPSENNTADFEEWLIYEKDAQFADELYKEQHKTEYNNYREEYEKELQNIGVSLKQKKYNLLKSIITKVEAYNPASPLLTVPTFTQEETAYLQVQGIAPSDYANILKISQNEIYNLVWSKADLVAYEDKCRKTNNRLHGIYNEADKTAWHQNWYTNAFLAMKGWALGLLEYIYSPSHHSIALDKEVEGFFNTAAKVPLSVIIGALRGKKHLAWKDLLLITVIPGGAWTNTASRALKDAGFSDYQVTNCRRTVMSMIILGIMWAIRSACAPPDDEDEESDEEDTLTGLIYYLSMRCMFEQEALIYLPEMFIQSGSLLDAMPVGGAALYDLGNLIYQGGGAVFSENTDNSTFFYQSDDPNGKYEAGDTKFLTHLVRLTPYLKSWWGLQHPYEAASSYEFGRKLRVR